MAGGFIRPGSKHQLKRNMEQQQQQQQQQGILLAVGEPVVHYCTLHVNFSVFRGMLLRGRGQQCWPGLSLWVNAFQKHAESYLCLNQTIYETTITTTTRKNAAASEFVAQFFSASCCVRTINIFDVDAG
jgi:hypothetical protein